MRSSKERPFSALSTEELANACRAESQQSSQQEQGYCFELFCRAFDGADNEAWVVIQTQYQRLMHHWLQTAVVTPLSADEANELIQEAFCRFWRLLQQQPQTLHQQFPHAGAVLRYLRCCVQTVAIDHQRQQQKEQRLREGLKLVVQTKHQHDWPEWESEQDTQLQQVQRYIAQRIDDPREQQLLHLAYTLGLKTREIVARYPDEFATAREVKRVKERVLKRMRRALQTFPANKKAS